MIRRNLPTLQNLFYSNDSINLFSSNDSINCPSEKVYFIVVNFLNYLPVEISSKVKYLSFSACSSPFIPFFHVNWPQTDPGMESEAVTGPFLHPRNRDSLKVQVAKFQEENYKLYSLKMSK